VSLVIPSNDSLADKGRIGPISDRLLCRRSVWEHLGRKLLTSRYSVSRSFGCSGRYRESLLFSAMV
jgi:hypothetical protein